MQLILKEKGFSTADMLPSQRFRLLQTVKGFSSQVMAENIQRPLNVKEAVLAIQVTTIANDPGNP